MIRREVAEARASALCAPHLSHGPWLNVAIGAQRAERLEQVARLTVRGKVIGKSADGLREFIRVRGGNGALDVVGSQVGERRPLALEQMQRFAKSVAIATI
ncbi:MAG: hypothetical protein RJA70_338 [Pseudomonadota bacterium]|jgi:hypothetical protein